MKLSEMIERYADSLRSEGHRPRGVDSYIWQLRRFLAWFGQERQVNELTTANLKGYQIELGAKNLAPGTIANSLTVIRSFCLFLMTEELLISDPTRKLKWPKEKEAAPRALHRDELVTVWRAVTAEACGSDYNRWKVQRNQRAIGLMLLAGLRIAEAAALCWADVDMFNQVLVVRNGKGGRSRSVPLTLKLITLLEAAPEHHKPHAVAGRPDGQPMTPKSMAHIFERWLPANYGLRISAHQLRHSLATELFRQNVHIRTIQALLGHKNMETTMRYLFVDDERKRDAVNRLEGW